MTWYNNFFIEKEAIKKLIKNLAHIYPEKYTIEKINIIDQKIQNFTDDFKNKKTLLEFFEYLKLTDSDLKFFIKDVQEYNTEINDNETQKILTSEISDLGYFFNNSDLEFFSGRVDEINFIIMTLNRKIKNNILIIGEPGTGKTTLMKKVSKEYHIPIFVVEMNKIISNTKYRGEFESKFTKLIEMSLESKFIIFIDEIHILLSSGRVDGGFSGADIVKPYITDPRIILTGATTVDEYEILKKDRALERRFNILHLQELNRESLKNTYIQVVNFLEIKTLNISNYEEILEKLDKIEHRNYPDKLIDYLDLYAANEKSGNRFNIDFIYEDSMNG